MLSEAKSTFGPALISHTTAVSGLSYNPSTYLTFHQSACQAVHSGRAITRQGHRSEARLFVVTEIRDGIMARIEDFLSVSIWLASVLYSNSFCVHWLFIQGSSQINEYPHVGTCIIEMRSHCSASAMLFNSVICCSSPVQPSPSIRKSLESSSRPLSLRVLIESKTNGCQT